MIASIPWFQSALNSFMNEILICYDCLHVFKLFHSFKRFIAYLCVPILSCFLISRHDHIFRHYLINGTVFGKNLNVKCVFWFSLQFVFETFPILRRNQRDVINVETSSCKVYAIFIEFSSNLSFLERFSKKSQIWNFIDTRPVGAKLFHADRRMDGRTDGHDKASSHFSQFCERS
jgi:hypothetical protein